MTVRAYPASMLRPKSGAQSYALCRAFSRLPRERDLPDSSYIGHWLKALQDDKRLIFSAAAHAQRAADYLHSLQPKQIEDEQAAA
jgi:antirestriction protein ArdC